MDYYVGMLVGAILAAMFFSSLISKILKWLPEKKKIISSHVIFVCLATIAGGYGMADGGDPKFAHAFSVYLIGAILSLIFFLNKHSKDSKEIESK